MKKTLTIVMAMVLVAAVAVTGTLAYMSAKSETVTNTFNFGNMTITLDESKLKDDGTLDKSDRVTANTYKVAPGATVAKDPTVHVELGSEKCYVYVSVQNNLVLENGDVVANYAANSGWTKIGEDADTHTVVYRYETAVDASSARQTLAPVFEEVTFDGEKITLDNIDQLQGKTIVINAYAHQSENIDSVAVADAAALSHFGINA